MTRVIIHPGFHKTGTTSLQRFLEINADALSPFVRVVLKPEMEDVAKSARDCSNVTGARGLLRRSRVRAAFKSQFTNLLNRLSLEEGQILLISCEALVGRMPGRDKVMAFDAAAGLAKDMRDVTLNHFGPEVDLTFLYTTRQQQSWMRSAYSHLLQQSRFTLTEEEFAHKYARTGDLDTIISQIRKAISPRPLVESRLEVTSPQHFGPASALLQLLDLPTDVMDTLVLAKQLNTGLDEIEQARMRTFNAQDIDDGDLSLKKRRYLRKRRKKQRNMSQ